MNVRVVRVVLSLLIYRQQNKNVADMCAFMCVQVCMRMVLKKRSACDCKHIDKCKVVANLLLIWVVAFTREMHKGYC